MFRSCREARHDFGLRSTPSHHRTRWLTAPWDKLWHYPNSMHMKLHHRYITRAVAQRAYVPSSTPPPPITSPPYDINQRHLRSDRFQLPNFNSRDIHNSGILCSEAKSDCANGVRGADSRESGRIGDGVESAGVCILCERAGAGQTTIKLMWFDL